ncbi:MAG TPA: hypothetical protein VGB24_18580 [Longimicrobium sp.]|jgi:hypothetical protein|uniref:hypothetical protein n=1 Tax=Longimicrobium sp. TaxID=2029185 RepID=UPI002ED96AB5
MSSPPATGTDIALSGTFTLNGVQVPVSSGSLTDLKKGIIDFTLAQPVVLGTLDELITWFNGPPLSLSIPSTTDIGSDLPTTPIDLRSRFEEATGGVLSITVLSIHRPATGPASYQLAINYSLDANPLEIIPGFVELDSIGLSISSGPVTTTSP